METMTPFSLASTPKIPSYSLPLPQARTVTIFSGRGCSVRSSSALTGVRRKGRNTTQLNCSRKFLSPTLIKCGGTVREIKENEFSDVVLKSELPVLVEFVATWCGPCRLIAPAVKSLAEEYEDKLMIVKVDHDVNPQLIEEYKVYGLPALILFQNGKEVPHSRREGAITKTKLKEYLDKLLESVSTF